MNHNRKPDHAYRPTNLPWLGNVPTQWEVLRLKANVSDVVNLTDSLRPGERYIALEHVEGWTGKISAPQPDVGFDSQVKRFKPSDVLFGNAMISQGLAVRGFARKVRKLPEKSATCP